MNQLNCRVSLKHGQNDHSDHSFIWTSSLTDLVHQQKLLVLLTRIQRVIVRPDELSQPFSKQQGGYTAPTTTESQHLPTMMATNPRLGNSNLNQLVCVFVSWRLVVLSPSALFFRLGFSPHATSLQINKDTSVCVLKKKFLTPLCLTPFTPAVLQTKLLLLPPTETSSQVATPPEVCCCRHGFKVSVSFTFTHTCTPPERKAGLENTLSFTHLNLQVCVCVAKVYLRAGLLPWG